MRRAVFIGVGLQRDLIEAEGALPVSGADRVLQAALRLKRHAAEREIPLILTQDTHVEDDPAFEAFPPHCVLGTPGHDLAPALEVSSYQVVAGAPLSHIEVSAAEPLVVHSPQHRRGIFGNVNGDKVIAAADAEEHVIFGLPLEIGIRSLSMGLRVRNKTTIVVSDALAHLDGERAAFHLASMAGMGCHFLPVEAVIQRYA